MPLINCPDCGNNISDRAASCIHCGAPIASRAVTRQPLTPLAKVLALALIAACLLIAYRVYTLTYKPLRAVTAEDLIEQVTESNLPTHVGGVYAQSIMNSKHPNTDVTDKRTFALMNERQLMINRSAPRLVNPLLTLRDVNYRHTERTIHYNYLVNNRLNINSIATLEQSLNERFCEKDQYALMRELEVSVTWTYWNASGMLLKTINFGTC